MKVKFEVKNGKFRFFILNRVLKLLLFIDHAKYKATSSEKCKKKTFQQMAPLNNANFKFSPLVALRRVRITAIAVLLVCIMLECCHTGIMAHHRYQTHRLKMVF